MREAQFQARIQEHQKALKTYQKTYNRIANLRLITLLVCIGATFFACQNQEQWVWWLPTIGLYVRFIYFVKQHQAIKEKIDYAESHIKINMKYIQRLTDGWKTFEDTGEALLDKEHAYAYDLDILGTNSLFQKINTTHTWYGRMRLQEVLLASDFDGEELACRQEAVRELIHDLDFCQQMEGVVSSNKKTQQNPERLIAYANNAKAFFKAKWMEKLVYTVPYLTLGSLVVGYVTQIKAISIMGVILMGVSYLYQFIYLGKINEVKGLLTAMMYDLATYKEVLEVLHQKEFKSPYLKQQVALLSQASCDALEGMKAIEKLGDKAAWSHQPLLAIPLDALWLWDLKVVLQTEEWCRNYGQSLEKWLKSIGEIESLVSLSVLGHIEDVTFPVVKEEGKAIVAQHLGHPLIAKEARVCNTFKMDEEIFIITGSNMSGKTTFLRTIGINLVLAYAGAPVLAKEMVCNKFQIATSMRIRDDLSEGISTFYAELTRIKMITEKAREEKKVLFLIDEIFRGTNSVDRIIGAKSVIKGVLKEGAIGAMTTHDLEMCQLEKEGTVRNYHFTEDYHENSITFDYLLKEGPSTTTNAKYLMKMVGIEIIE